MKKTLIRKHYIRLSEYELVSKQAIKFGYTKTSWEPIIIDNEWVDCAGAEFVKKCLINGPNFLNRHTDPHFYEDNYRNIARPVAKIIGDFDSFKSSTIRTDLLVNYLASEFSKNPIYTKKWFTYKWQVDPATNELQLRYSKSHEWKTIGIATYIMEP